MIARGEVRLFWQVTRRGGGGEACLVLEQSRGLGKIQMFVVLVK